MTVPFFLNTAERVLPVPTARPDGAALPAAAGAMSAEVISQLFGSALGAALGAPLGAGLRTTNLEDSPHVRPATAPEHGAMPVTHDDGGNTLTGEPREADVDVVCSDKETSNFGLDAIRTLVDRVLADRKPKADVDAVEAPPELPSAEMTAPVVGRAAMPHHREDARVSAEQHEMTRDERREENRESAPVEAVAPVKTADAVDVARFSRVEQPKASLAVRDATHVVRDLSTVHPELRARVERVIDRMYGEYGHDVRVSESWRSPERQQHLYAQGRSNDESVVTWTRHSRHTDGLAVDLIVDGDWNDKVAYTRLQRIAKEEGLHTLGPRDLSHVELRIPGNQSVRVESANFAQPERAESKRAVPASPSPRAADHASNAVATPAEPARVASIARVAPVAEVATPHANAAAAASAAPRATPAAPRKKSAPAGTTDVAPAPVRFPSDVVAAKLRESASGVVATTRAGASMAEHVDRVNAVRDLPASGPVSGLTLRVENAQGNDERVRIDVRGRQVAARIDAADLTRAADLSSRLPELSRALESQGFEAPALHVRSNVSTPMKDLFSAPIVADAVAVRLPGTSEGRNDSRSSHDDRAQSQAHQQEQRQRSRREREGEQHDRTR